MTVIAMFVVLQSAPITPLERLALLAVLAVAVIAVVRVVTGRRERRRFARHRDPDFSPLQLYRTGVQKPINRTRAVASARDAAPETRPTENRPGVDTGAGGRQPAERAPSPAVRPTPVAQPSSTASAPATAPQPSSAAAATAPAARPPVQAQPSSAAAATTPTARPPVQPQPRPRAAPTVREAAPLLTEEVVDTGAVRFHRVADGTLQLLPGRLEILAGADSREEIRFVKLAGREPSFTFGRSPGEPHVHVQLQSPTVSRLHARMRCHEGIWLLSNLSRTNPVVVNGTAVSNGSEQRLQDGDRVEMGEIVFQFRSR